MSNCDGWLVACGGRRVALRTVTTLRILRFFRSFSITALIQLAGFGLLAGVASGFFVVLSSK